MQGKYADLAYKCGLYHQLGKALVPPEYQIWANDFSEEERAVYRKYTTDGRALVATLQARSERAWERRKGETAEQPTKNIPWLMIRESCEQHMERWNGTGYPALRKGNEISVIAQIVGLAKELDRLASGTKSEDPFTEAYRVLIEQSGTLWNPELIELLKLSRTKCRAVYNKYVHYTMALPKTIPLVEKRKERPMGLNYRPMVCDTEGTVVAYEAIPWFGGIADNPSETENAEILEPQLRRLGLVGDVSTYFLYEVTDTLLRIENCKLSAIDTIVLDMIPSFFLDAPDLSKFETLFEHQPIDKSRLILTVPAFVAVNANPDVEKSLKDCAELGVMLMVDSWDPDTLPLERVKELGFQYVRLHPDQYLKKEIADLLSSLPANGITAYAKDADTEDALRWLVACGVKHFVSVTTGYPVDEDSLIRDSLLREREDG
jgi:EAL domain-containing protein (putative c-di-GMP-specific phosphodiesterase class I)